MRVVLRAFGTIFMSNSPHWTKTRVVIHLNPNRAVALDDTGVRDAWVTSRAPGLCIVRPYPGAPYWSITHQPTGMGVGAHCRTLNGAKWLVIQFAACSCDWTEPNRAALEREVHDHYREYLTMMRARPEAQVIHRT